jgi:hypothetical protein
MANILPLTTPAFTSPAISKVSGGVQFSFSAQVGQHYRVLATTDLRQPLNQWIMVTNGTFGSSPAVFADNATNSPGRFYRIVSP